MGRPVYKDGNRNLRSWSVESATVISVGDLLYRSDTIGNVKPASDFTWNSDLATTQAGFADVCAGIAFGASASGETEDISVDNSPDAVYEFDCASDTYYFDDSVGPDKAAGNALLDQQVEKAVGTSSCGRVVEKVEAAATRVQITILSPYHASANSTPGTLG